MQGNIFGPIATINAFLPLIRAGKAKKIVHISTGLADPDFNRVSQIPAQVGYSTSKAAAVVLIAKYASELAPEGIKVVSLSPGWVATEAGKLNLSIPASSNCVLMMWCSPGDLHRRQPGLRIHRECLPKGRPGCQGTYSYSGLGQTAT